MDEYKPGICNIGKNEIRKRYALAAVGFILSAVIVYLLILYSLPKLSLLLVFFPLTLAFEGLYQGYFKFCAGFAGMGVYDFEGSGGKRGKVTKKESHTLDLAKANLIHLYSILSSIIVTIVIYVISK